MSHEEILAQAKKNGYSRLYAEYYSHQPFCEACLEAGIQTPAGWPHHILTRGAHGPIDKEWNLLSLCQIHHTVADTWSFSVVYPRCGEKIQRAREKNRGIRCSHADH